MRPAEDRAVSTGASLMASVLIGGASDSWSAWWDVCDWHHAELRAAG